jgi:hypothetical protein
VKLILDRRVNTHVAWCISTRDEPAGIEFVNRGAQLVPELLGPLGQRPAIQCESAKFLYYANGLACAVEIGVDYSANRSFHNKINYTARHKHWVVKIRDKKSALAGLNVPWGGLNAGSVRREAAT